MKTKFALLLVFCAISLNIFAQEKKIKDRRTNPELYYLEESEVANSLELLPPPPEAGSILFLYDKARYDWGKLQRDTPRGEQDVSALVAVVHAVDLDVVHILEQRLAHAAYSCVQALAIAAGGNEADPGVSFHKSPSKYT